MNAWSARIATIDADNARHGSARGAAAAMLSHEKVIR